jgi:hypothetical protein
MRAVNAFGSFPRLSEYAESMNCGGCLNCGMDKRESRSIPASFRGSHLNCGGSPAYRLLLKHAYLYPGLVCFEGVSKVVIMWPGVPKGRDDLLDTSNGSDSTDVCQNTYQTALDDVNAHSIREQLCPYWHTPPNLYRDASIWIVCEQSERKRWYHTIHGRA